VNLAIFAGIVGGVGAVVVGALLQRSGDSRHWLRDQRLRVYTEFVGALQEAYRTQEQFREDVVQEWDEDEGIPWEVVAPFLTAIDVDFRHLLAIHNRIRLVGSPRLSELGSRIVWEDLRGPLDSFSHWHEVVPPQSFEFDWFLGYEPLDAFVDAARSELGSKRVGMPLLIRSIRLRIVRMRRARALRKRDLLREI
jgi:hypothetical protein